MGVISPRMSEQEAQQATAEKESEQVEGEHPYGFGHPGMGYGYGHPGMGYGHGMQMNGYGQGFCHGPAPAPAWQNRYMETNGFSSPMPNWQPESASSHFPSGYGSDGYPSRYNREGQGKGMAMSVARRDYHFVGDSDPNARHSHSHQGTWNPFYSKDGQGRPAIYTSKERYAYGKN